VEAKVHGIEVLKIRQGAVIEPERVQSIDYLEPGSRGAIGAILEVGTESQ
jgi:hypothetical protein